MQLRSFERRVVTVLSADAIGYSRLTGLDEDATHSVLSRDRKIIFGLIDKYRGRIFSRAGDGLMAEFPDPLAAVRCALQIEAAIEEANGDLPPALQMRFRMGVNAGDAIVESDELFGDDVNIAARLQQAATGQGILVSETIRDHVQGKLDVVFEDLGEREFKNIDRAVHTYWVSTATNGQVNKQYLVVSPDTAAPVRGFSGHPALAVIPFDNASDGSDLAYLADGLSEDLITGLSRLRWLPVIARNSSFLFRDHPINAGRIGKLLGARYLLEGSVRLVGQRLRVSAALIDTRDPNVNIWTGRYDRGVDEIFNVQDEITENIVAALETQIERIEQRRSYAKPPEQLDTWDLVRRGMWHQAKLTRRDALEARRLFDEALIRDRMSTEAHIQLAWWIFWDVWVRRASKEELIEMEQLAVAALRLDPLDARPPMLLGIAQLLRGDPVACRAPLEDSIKLNPSLAVAHASIGSSHILVGDPRRAIEPLRTAIRLSPHDLYLFHTAGELGAAYCMLGRWDRGLEWCEKSLRLRPGYWYARVIRIGALARSGEVDKAAQELSELLKRRPDFRTEQLKWLPFVDRNWNDFFIHGLELAGLVIHEST